MSIVENGNGKKISKKEQIITSVQDVLATYTSKLTLRQIYYRLVAKHIIQNNVYEYKNLSKILVDARKNGKINYDAMEDRTRTVQNHTNTNYTFWKEEVMDKIEGIRNPPYISYNNNLWQEKITLIVLEKQALEGIFQDSISAMCILVVCRGYNSLTQIKQLADLLKDEDREINCYFFSDFDPTGLDIQRNFKAQCEELGLKFNKFERRALIPEQIRLYNLPSAPPKAKDSRAKSWEEGGVVELDALEPTVLERLIKDCARENWNHELYKRIMKVERIQKRRAKKMYIKKLREFAKEIANEEDSD